MLKLILLTVLLLGVTTSQDNIQKIRNVLNIWNWDVQCWGEQNVLKQRLVEKTMGDKCNQMPSTSSVSKSRSFRLNYPSQSVSLPANTVHSGYVSDPYRWKYLGSSYGNRGKRHAIHYRQNMFQVMPQNVRGLAQDYTNNISNLTCVLQTLTIVDSDLQLNRALFETELYKRMDLTATDNLNDPVWRKKMSTLWIECINLSESWPQASLDRDPGLQMFGPMARAVLFMRCNKDAKRKMCGAAQIQKLITTYYDSHSVHLGVAADKYEKATAFANNLLESSTPQEELLEELFHGEL